MPSSLFGSLSDVVTALTAIGALIAAIIGGKQAKRLFQIESARDAEAARRTAQEQASKVFAWVATRTGETPTFGVVIVNSSEQAIYDVEAQVIGHEGVPRPTARLTNLPPGSYYLEERHDSYGWSFAANLRSFDDEIQPVTKSKTRCVRVLRFRDSSNALWQRSADGRLHPSLQASHGRSAAEALGKAA